MEDIDERIFRAAARILGRNLIVYLFDVLKDGVKVCSSYTTDPNKVVGDYLESGFTILFTNIKVCSK